MHGVMAEPPVPVMPPEVLLAVAVAGEMEAVPVAIAVVAAIVHAQQIILHQPVLMLTNFLFNLLKDKKYDKNQKI
jgi:hypothetical protein